MDEFKREEEERETKEIEETDEMGSVEEEKTEETKPIEKPRKKAPGLGRLFLLLILAALVGSSITFALIYQYLPEIMTHRGLLESPDNRQSVVIEPSDDISVYTAVAQKAMPSVVGITTVQVQQDRFFGTRRSEGLGTGVIVDERGYILTNSHVIGDGRAEQLAVILHDGSQQPAEVLWYEQSMDLAVIKVESETNLQPAELGDSDQLEVGEIAIAIGNPLGLNFERTLTQGVISGLNRSIQLGQGIAIDNLIQTDASINPGNSGGPLLNAQGQVIGINTAKVQTGEGLGFAIPINTSKPIVDQFIERGEFSRVYLGIRGYNVSDFEGATGITLSAENGVYIVEVVAGSVAEKADLRPGDVIVAIGEEEIETMGDLIRALYKYRPGCETTVEYIRNEQEQRTDIIFLD